MFIYIKLDYIRQLASFPECCPFSTNEMYFYFGHRPIEASAVIFPGPLQYYNPLKNVAKVNHWYVILVLGSAKYRFEGVCNIERNNKLVPLVTRCDEVEIPEGHHFATLNSKLYVLLQASVSVPINYTLYSLTLNNCQCWVRSFLTNISNDMLQRFNRNTKAI